MRAFLVGRSQKRYNRPVEVCFLCLKYIMLVGSTTICSNFVVLLLVHCTILFNKKVISPADLL